MIKNYGNAVWTLSEFGFASGSLFGRRGSQIQPLRYAQSSSYCSLFVSLQKRLAGYKKVESMNATKHHAALSPAPPLYEYSQLTSLHIYIYIYSLLYVFIITVMRTEYFSWLFVNVHWRSYSAPTHLGLSWMKRRKTMMMTRRRRRGRRKLNTARIYYKRSHYNEIVDEAAEITI